MRVGLTDDRVNERKYALYEEWLFEIFALRDRPGPGGDGDVLQTVRLTPGDGNAGRAAECDGVVLTGGGDVDPGLYGGDRSHPTLSGVSGERDRFEMEVLQSCIGARIPVLGICRGMQLANVAAGGTLIVDLGEAGFGGHRPPRKGGRCEHHVDLGPDSILRENLRCGGGTVVSSHHQAVGKIGRGLRVAATAPDGVVEALESDTAPGGGLLLLVQWHPERAGDAAEPLCNGPGKVFFQSIASNIKLNGKLT